MNCFETVAQNSDCDPLTYTPLPLADRFRAGHQAHHKETEYLGTALQMLKLLKAKRFMKPRRIDLSSIDRQDYIWYCPVDATFTDSPN